jgi:aspartate racemase
MQPNEKATAGFSEARRALLQRYLRGGVARSDAKPATIPKRKESGPAPLSYSQQQVWLHSQLAGAYLIYNEPITIHRHGELNVSALERSFTEIVRRHEAWRTTFQWDGDHGVQIVLPAPAHIEIPFIDLRSHPQAEREALRLATEDARQPFDLARGPMYRLRLVRLRDEEHRLFLTLHHIIFDGVSLYRVLLPELLTSYEAFAKNESPVLGELPIQYPDYAVWQRDSIKQIPPEQLPYWKAVCDDLPVLDLKTDRSRPAAQTYAGAMETFQISSSTTAALKVMRQEQGVTPFMTMVAAFTALLHGYTGQEDVVIGGVSSGRDHVETEGLLGCFLNTFVIRCAFSKDLPFTELLARARSATLGALSHDGVPFELLVQKFARKRDPSRAPLVQVLIVVEPPLTPLQGGWAFTHMDVDTGTAKFDLQLELDDRPEGLTGRFIYNTNLFERETIEVLKSRWLKLLDRIAVAPTQRVRDLTAAVWRETECEASPSRDTAGDAERRKLLVDWNDTRTNYPRDAAIHEVFEEQARRTPSSVAVVFGDARLTYDELNRRANRLARRLQKLGVGRDLPVGLCMDRSPEMVIALLAVLKAGGAYVPLDPAYPAKRLSLMIEDTGMAVVLTHRRVRNLCASASRATPKVHMLCIDAENFTNEDETNLASEVRANDLAYVMYTSGSTGTPKGVAVTHRGVVRLVKNTQYASFSPEETFLQLAPISFDASTFEIWGALLNGGRLVVMPPQTPSLEELGLALRQNSVTTLWLTAGLFHLMVDERLDDLRGLRQLLAGGDVLSPAHVRRAVEALPDCKIINGYGPTENTTFTCCHAIDRADVGHGAVPLGRPIGNTTVYILDETMAPVPVGVTGELYIGGDGLAREYWRQPKLTAANFVRNPFSKTLGARLYKSGDLGRWRADGVVEFVGRADDQVKVSGYRVELGEIETALRQHEAVRDAAVAMRERRQGAKEFVAYVIPAVNPGPSAHELREFLRRTLPDAAVPVDYMLVEVFPLTSNGKVDRRALSNPSKRHAPTAAPPQTNLEHTISSVWREVIGHPDEIGVNENFFDLGGSSLRVIEVHARLERAVHRSFPLTALFQYPTIQTLSAFLDSKGNIGTDFARINERALRQRVARAQRQGMRTRK